MELDIEMLDKILKLHDKAKGVFKIEDRNYCYGTPQQISEPQQGILEVESLQGLIDYVHGNKDGIDHDLCTIHIVDHTSVMLHGKVNRETGIRPLFVHAEISSKIKSFPFDRWLEHEEFMIKLYSLFQWDADKVHEEFAKKVSAIKSTDTDESTDNKIATNKTKTSGISIPEDRTVFTINLSPYRTFAEVKQPTTPFIFRVRKDRNEGIQCALFECDGGAWVNEVRLNISSFLLSSLKEKRMPIFA
jgi:hypothetical protein